MERKVVIPREVWRPISRCKYEEGTWMLVQRENGMFVKVQVYQGNLWKPCHKNQWEIITDALKYIPFPSEDLFEAEEFATNDIPTELVLPYIKRERDNAVKALEEEREANKEKFEELYNQTVLYKNLAEARIKALEAKLEKVKKATSLKEGARELTRLINVLVCNTPAEFQKRLKVSKLFNESQDDEDTE